jgi:cyanosortase A-associated protein
MKLMMGRSLLLTVLNVSLLLAIAKLLFDPTATQRQPVPVQWPTTLSLPGWHLVNSDAIQDAKLASVRYNRLLSGHHYRYRQHHLTLDIEIRDIGNSNGDVAQLLNEQILTQPPSDLKVQAHSPVGFYALFGDQQKAELTSCINPNGESTVTLSQFQHNQWQQSFRGDRLWQWAIGQRPLPENRCLWVLISLSADTPPTQPTYLKLQQTWEMLLPQFR